MPEGGYRFAGRVPPGIEPDVPGPGQESVWDFPRPPRIEPVVERVRAVVAGVTIADSVRALRVVETAGAPVYYVPPEDVRTDLLAPSTHATHCEWKGAASYRTFSGSGRTVRDVAWCYERPAPGFESIAGYYAFYAGKLDEAWVGDERATPQPGGFYGGWLTSRITGPVKGSPGTWGW